MKLKFIDYSLITHFDQVARLQGLRHAAAQLLTALRVGSVTVQGKWPTAGPLLLIANHPGELDMMTLLSVIPRSDFYFIAQATYYVYGTKLESRLLPVRRTVQIYNRIFEFPLHLSHHQRREDLSLPEAQRKNRHTIKRAAKLVSTGKMVSIFPMGYVGKKSMQATWKKGVGHLIKQIKNPGTQLVFAQINGAQSGDFLRYLHPWIRQHFFPLQHRKILLAQPKLLFKVISVADSADEIVQKLEKMYEQTFPA